MKALIVEDEQVAQNLLSHLLRPYGECDLAEDGEKGLELFLKAFESDHPYDVIFLDIMMPRLDGQTMLSRIRDFEQSNDVRPRTGVKVIMTTALGDPENVLTSHVEGCAAYLTKPLDNTALHKIMAELGFAREVR